MNIGFETEKIEFKRTTGEHKEAMESICAILNKHSEGVLYFGVDDNGDVKGQQVSDSTKKDISRWVAESIEPRITVTIETIPIKDKSYIKVSFFGENKPYNVNGTFYTRIGTENRKMSTEELRRLIKQEDYSSHWDEKITDFSVDEIDENSLRDFYENATSCGRLSFATYDRIQLLSALELSLNGYLNNAGYALFGKKPGISLKMATYASDDKVTFIDLKNVQGNIYQLVNIAIEYIHSRINWGASISKRKRTEVPEIPTSAIREIVINSFAHANYESGKEIEISIHPGKIVIYNPGRFPEDLTPYDFVNKNISSLRRNRIILETLFRSKDVEKSGTGFQRVNLMCEKEGIKWDFEKFPFGFAFIFNRKSVHTNVQSSVQINSQLNDSEHTIYSIIRDNPHISKPNMALRIGKSERTVQRIISSLISKGLVVREGSNKAGYWRAL